MQKPDGRESSAVELRKEAETRIAQSRGIEADTGSDSELLRELQVYRVELEMQNATLRQSQIVLEASRDRYIDFYDTAPIGCVTLGDHGLIAEINLAGAEMLGLPRAKLLQRRFDSFVVAADCDGWHQQFTSALQQDAKLACEVALQRADGSCIDVRLDSLRLTKNGQTPLLPVVLTDISETKNSQIALRSALRLQESILDAAPVAIIATTPDGIINRYNSGAERMLGYSAEEMIGHGSMAMLHDPLELAARAQELASQSTIMPMPEFATPVEETERGKTNVNEWTLVRKNGSHFPALISSVALRAEDGEVNGFLCVAIDISERKQSERQRLGHERQLRGALMREVHHRIKNHLQGLTGLVRQNAKRHPALAPMVDDLVAQIAAIATVHGLQGRDHGRSICLPMVINDIVKLPCRSGRIVIADESLPVECNLTLNEEDAVPVALIVNELVTNALRHGDPASNNAAHVEFECTEISSAVTIRNAGTLPPNFDFAAGKGVGTGLELVRSLLPPQGAMLEIRSPSNGMIECRLTLTSPVVVDRGIATKCK